MAVAILSPFGQELRHWRRLRHLSQLDLAYSAGTTTRHLSFLETGRSRPSRDMIERLSEVLAVPLRERNVLMQAAGFAAPYREGALDRDDLASFDAVVERMLAQHEPYPAMAVDRRWNIVRANGAAARLLDGCAERNGARLIFVGPWRHQVANWPAVAWNTLGRLRDDLSRSPDDAELRALVDLAVGELAHVPRPAEIGSDRVVCPHFTLGAELVKTISVVARFGSPRDVTLDEIRIELMYPDGEAAERFFRSAARGEPGAAPAGRSDVIDDYPASLVR